MSSVEVPPTRPPVTAGGRWRIAALASLAVALLLAWPAWRGLVELPRLQAGQADMESEITGLRGQSGDVRTRLEEAAERVRRGSGARILRLPGDGDAGMAAVTLPEAALFLPVEVRHPLARRGTLPPEARITVIVKRLPDQRELWRLSATVDEVWDATAGTIGLLVPTARLPLGDYRLEIMSAESRAAAFVGQFRVAQP